MPCTKVSAPTRSTSTPASEARRRDVGAARQPTLGNPPCGDEGHSWPGQPATGTAGAERSTANALIHVAGKRARLGWECGGSRLRSAPVIPQPRASLWCGSSGKLGGSKYLPRRIRARCSTSGTTSTATGATRITVSRRLAGPPPSETSRQRWSPPTVFLCARRKFGPCTNTALLRVPVPCRTGSSPTTWNARGLNPSSKIRNFHDQHS